MNEAEHQEPTTLAGGRYLLAAPLGEGGMATVYRGFDTRLQVWRAIKVLNPKYARSRKVKARFDAEAQTMALLEHPNIVRVYDVGTIGEISYIVMELVQGGTPVDWLEHHGAMPPRLALDVIEQLCHGIEAAHAKGVIHRDIKPHNVLVTLKGVCRVTDFGIARVGDGDRSMTKTGAVMGTWGYMAPEQRSDAKTVDERGDVYAIAATLYTLLTNRIPMDLFAADRDKSVMSGVPDALYEIMLKATDYDRERRYASVAELRTTMMEAARALPPDPPDTPPLVVREGLSPSPPTPEDYARATPLVNESSGPVSPTLLPNSAVDGTSADNTMAPATPPGVPSLGSDATKTLDITDVPAPAPRKRGAMAWLLALVPLLLGLLLLGGAAVLLVPVALGLGGSDTGQPMLVAETDEPGTDTDTDTDTDTGQGMAEVEPEPETPTQPALQPPVVPTSQQGTPDPRPEPEPEPESTSEGSAEGDTDAGGSVQAGADPPESSEGTADPPEDPPPVEVDVRVAPEEEQCIQATPPTTSSVGARLSFQANLCIDEGQPVTLHYRAAGAPSWQSVRMPKRLGSRFALVDVDERHAAGLEFYIETEGATFGSRTAPRRVSMR